MGENVLGNEVRNGGACLDESGKWLLMLFRMRTALAVERKLVPDTKAFDE